jgi:formate dehydrogenase major subunit
VNLNRRDFFKISGISAVSLILLNQSNTQPVFASSGVFPLKHKIKETYTVCCYCAVGCGAIISTYEDGRIKVEGAPVHPINEGSLCPKGLAMAQIHQLDGRLNPYRLIKPRYRAPNSLDWEEKSWEWMIETIATRVKDTREKYWNAQSGRTDALASLGGGELDNEECYLLSKMNRALGVVFLEHCARI